MLKKSLILLSILSAAAFAGCDDDDDSNGITPAQVCQNTCEKDEECGTNDYDTVQECVDQCRPMADNMLQSFGEDLNACYMAASCTDIQAGTDDCLDDAMEDCTSDPDPALDTTCAVMLECDNGVAPSQEEIDACVAQFATYNMDGMLSCFVPSALADYETCIEEGPCSETLMEDCMESELGITD